MCGIGGILRVWTPDQRDLALRTPHAQSIPEAWLDILDDAVKHRGPDGQGRFRDRAIRADGCVVDVAFVHRRLSIIDHAGGHQPMVLQLPKGALSASSGEARPIPGRLLSVEELQSHNRRVLAESNVTSNTQTPELALRALSSQEHDRIAVVFNGCIYNHRELRAELQKAGHVFTTDHSDTEVLVHGWREWGQGLFPRLDGMFSLAVWSSVGSLWLARDQCGEKPMYMRARSSPQGRIFSFASVPPHRIWNEHPRLTSCGRIREDFAGWIRFGFFPGEPDFPFDVRPAMALPVDTIHLSEPGDSDGALCSGAHRLSDREFFPAVKRSRSLPAGELEQLLDNAVRSRLDADVPLGCLLSGGVDSSLVATFAKRHHPHIKTFCVRMPTPEFDESEFAASAAKAIGSEHTTLDCDARPADDLVRLIHHLGLPFGDSSLLPSFWVCRAARQHVKVALSGDGGDELFAGYERYRAFQAMGLSWLALPLLLGGSLVSPGPGVRSWRERLHRYCQAALGEGYLDLISIFPSAMATKLGVRPRLHWSNRWCELNRYSLNTPDLAFGLYGPLVESKDRAQKSAFWPSRISRSIRHDMIFYLPEDLMRKSDTASMAAGLELRSPFLAKEVVGATLTAKLRHLMPHGQRKGLLRQVARKYLPAEIVDRPKMGFAIPIGEWFRSDYGGLRTMLLDHLNSTEPFGPPSLGIDLNMAFIRQMLDEHLGTGPSGLVKRDHSQRLYMLLVLSIWAKWLGSLR